MLRMHTHSPRSLTNAFDKLTAGGPLYCWLISKEKENDSESSQC